MNKNKFMLKTIITLLVTVTIGSFIILASSDNYFKNKVVKSTEQYTSKKSDLDNTITFSTYSRQVKNTKDTEIKLDDLNKEPKTEKEYRAELQEFIEGCRAGLEDSKRDLAVNYKQSKQEFIEKMEKKLNTIEAEMKENDKAAKQNNNLSDKNSSKKLLERLLDRSDVDK